MICAKCGKHFSRRSSRYCSLECSGDVSRGKKHGMCYSAEHLIWRNMIYRCTKQSFRDYHLYGGRGISVCERWMTFENFYDDMGPRPGGEYSIDRIDNNAGYSPENCKWATKLEQTRNRRPYSEWNIKRRKAKTAETTP